MVRGKRRQGFVQGGGTQDQNGSGPRLACAAYRQSGFALPAALGDIGKRY